MTHADGNRARWGRALALSAAAGLVAAALPFPGLADRRLDRPSAVPITMPGT